MVMIIDPKPQPEAMRETICRNCGIRLSYVRNDVHSKYQRDYDGSGDTYYHIVCPGCTKNTSVKAFY